MQIPDFSSAKLLVVGDLMLDRYWHGGASRISPEAPVPVVRVSGREERVGGAGNVAVNMAALGAQVSLMGVCGQDEAGDVLLALLERAGIDCHIARSGEHPTITKLRVISRNQQLIRLDFEADLASHASGALPEGFESRLDAADAVVLSDYGKGTLAAVERFISAGRQAGKTVLVDPKGKDFGRYRGASVVTPNQAEFETVVGLCRSEQDLCERAGRLLMDLDWQALLVTRGEQGMSLFRRDSEPLHLPARAREVFDVTGAGDTVISVLAAGLAAGQDLVEATALANLAAGLVVGKLGTASVGRAELAYALQGERAHGRGPVDLASLLEVLGEARRAGEKIVLTNGCFDILHPGHVRYLQQARGLGDRLVVLVNGDDSVRRLKGSGRPVNPLADRMAMLAALECVDWVLPFHEDTPRELICRILPDILVKGGDYPDIRQIAGHDCVLAHGGQVRVLGFVEGHSTTRLIETIRQG